MPIDRIAIVGGGLAGWMTASVLSRVLNDHQCRVEIIGTGDTDDSLGPFLPALTTMPTARQFHAEFGYSEDQILAKSNGCFSLGSAISGWTKSGAPCFHPFGDTGAALGHVSFHQLAARLRTEDVQVNLPDYSLAALCAQTSRFARPPKDCETVLSSLDYGLVLETAGYTAFFKQDALSRGVSEVSAEMQNAAIGDDGLIESVTTVTNEQIKADLFIDCTGVAARLISALPENLFENWTHWLPCDRISNQMTPSAEHPQPFAHIAAHHTGWNRFLTTTGYLHDGVVSKGSELYNAIEFTAGRRAVFWQSNCVALGGAAAVLEPLSPLPLQLLQNAIRRLITLLPNDRRAVIERREFNRLTSEELECARDFAILPYKINGRIGEVFWDACRDMEVPERLAHRIGLYQSTGRVALYDGDLFEEADWVALFDAQGILPRRYDPAANGIPLLDIRDHFVRIREIMIRELANIPFHHEYLKSVTG